MSRGMQMTMRGGRSAAFDPALFPGAAFYVDTSRSTITKANVVSGTGASLSKSGSTITLTGGVGLVASHAGGTITLGGYGAGNNVKATILTATTNGCTYANAAGASEAGSGSKTWAIEGQCVGITDLVSGQTLSQAGAITTQLAVSTSDNASGKPVIGQAATGARWLTLDSTAVAGMLNGNLQATWFCYFMLLTNPGGFCTPIQYRDAVIGTSPACEAQLQCTVGATQRGLFYQASAGAWSLFAQSAGAALTLGQWYSLAVVYDGGSGADIYQNGAFVQSVTGVQRTLSALRSVTLGLVAGTTATPQTVGGGKIAGAGVWLANIGAANIAAMDAYYRGWQP